MDLQKLLIQLIKILGYIFGSWIIILGLFSILTLNLKEGIMLSVFGALIFPLTYRYTENIFGFRINLIWRFIFLFYWLLLISISEIISSFLLLIFLIISILILYYFNKNNTVINPKPLPSFQLIFRKIFVNKKILQELEELFLENNIESVSREKISSLLLKYNIENEKKLKNNYLEIFQNKLKLFLKDEKINKKEEEILEKIKNSLLLKDDDVIPIYQEEVKPIILKFLEKVSKIGKFSPKEEEEMNSLFKKLKIKPTFDKDTTEYINKLKLFWQIENKNFPKITEIDIQLNKNEICFFVAKNCNLHEYRKIISRYDYHGINYRLKLAKGLSYRMGSMQIKPVSKDILSLIDSGNLYLTNKRIIFKGNIKNISIKFDKIIGYEAHSNGATIQKEAGKSPFFEFENNSDIFCVILDKLKNPN